MKKTFYMFCALLALVMILPSSVKAQKITDGKLTDCQFTSMDKYTIPEEVTVIDTMCFYGSSITEVTITKNVKRIAPMAFYMCPSLKKVIFVDDATVEEIGESAFGENTSLAEITLPNSVRVLGQNAFTFDENLKKVVLSENLERLSYGTFGTCTSLTKLDIPASVKVIEDFAIANNPNLKRVVINGADSIGARSFYHNTSLFDVQLPETLKEIGDSCFMRCNLLEEITLPASLEKVGDKMFFMCPDFLGYKVAEGSKNFTAVDGVLYSKDMKVLHECPQQFATEMFELPAETEVIRPAAFFECINVKGIKIPSTIKSIGIAALANNGMSKFDFVGNEKYVVEGSSIYAILKSADGYAFLAHPSKCADTKIVVLPNTKLIADFSMAYNEFVETVYFPKELMGMSHAAMQGDTAIKDIYSYATTAPQVADHTVFAGIDLSKALLHVTSDIKVYQSYNDAGWLFNLGDDIPEEYPITTGIEGVENDVHKSVAAYYSVDGTLLNAPVKGINIVKYTDGTSKKVIM